MSNHHHDAARIAAFIRSIEDRSAAKTVPWSLGTAMFHPDFPNKYDLNYLRLERDDPSVGAPAVAEEAHRLQSAAGLSHRKVSVEDSVGGARLAQGFRKLDWNVTRLVWMTLQGPRPGEGPVEVVETDLDDARDAWIALDTDERDMSLEEAEMLWASMRDVTARVTNMRLFCGLVDGKIAGWCEYYSEDGVGQVENVSTSKIARDRGVARSVIAKVLQVSASEGNEIDFLIADDDDWPKELYARLGYRPVAYTYDFLLKPATG